MSSALTIRAGQTALGRLRDGGWDPDWFSSLVGASGGPKWLVLSQIDRVLATEFVAPRKQPLAVLGSSIGTFRHLCLAQKDPLAALERFEEAYIAQAYESEPTPREVSLESERVIEVLFDRTGREEVLTNPAIGTHIIAVRSRRPVASDGRTALALGLGVAAIANAIDRRWLAAFFERAVFHSGTNAFSFDDFHTQTIGLSTENLDAAALASGSIPIVMDGVDAIPGARAGRYRDGGIIDYHFDFAFGAPDGLILYPHFFERITPGWFDKGLGRRRPSGAALDRTVLITPAPTFVGQLPGGKVPDRDDFRNLSTSERQTQWHKIVDCCRKPADELADLLAAGRLGEVAEPFGPG
jgi:hypothetical protein